MQGKHPIRKTRLPQITVDCAVLDALSELACLLDADGHILVTNNRWDSEGEKLSVPSSCIGAGSNYLQVCERAAGESSEGAREASEGIRAVLCGEQTHHEQVYPCFSGANERWYMLRVVMLTGPQARALVTHRDVTEQVLWQRRVRHRFGSLSDRELQILELLVRGLSSQEIADQLERSKNTIDAHRRSIMSKTKARNVAELVTLAVTGSVVQVETFRS